MIVFFDCQIFYPGLKDTVYPSWSGFSSGREMPCNCNAAGSSRAHHKRLTPENLFQTCTEILVRIFYKVKKSHDLKLENLSIMSGISWLHWVIYWDEDQSVSKILPR